jgi:hypothetical protein
MDRVISLLTNKYLVAAVTGLFVLGFVKKLAGR